MLERGERREGDAEVAAAAAVTTALERQREVQHAEQEARLRQVANATDREGLTGTVQVHRQGLRDLEAALDELSQREQRVELERLRDINKQLLLLREKERIKAFREQQRKQVEIEATPD